MTLRTTSIFLLTISILLSCSDMTKRNNRHKEPDKKSRVADFYYGGYGDTVCATLIGQVFVLDTSIKSKDSLTPLLDVKVTVQENNKSVLTNANGQFVIPFYKGIYSLLLTKNGYQSLLLKNFISDPDQYSQTKIYLEKGTELQTFEIPKSGTQ